MLETMVEDTQYLAVYFCKSNGYFSHKALSIKVEFRRTINSHTESLIPLQFYVQTCVFAKSIWSFSFYFKFRNNNNDPIQTKKKKEEQIIEYHFQ